MSQNVALELRAVVRNYGKGAIVGPITAEVKQGEFISLLGPSGCGKTTMLRCIAGFESVDEGSVLVNGVDISRKPPHKRNIGLVFQSYALFPHLTVRENVRFGLRMQKLVPAAEADVQVRDALGVVGLSHLADRYPAQLSGGQQQRVAIARSVVLNPPLLLLDEPLSNLDFKLRVQMREELRSLQRRLGTTFVYVTHDQTEALAMSDRVVVLSQGKIAQIGTPREIYDNPASRFVADFIGASNLLKVVDSRPLGQKLEVSLENGCKMICRPGSDTGGGERWVSVRPENIKAVPEGVATQQDTNVFRVKVLSKTFCGDKFEIWARLQGAEENCDAGSNILMHVSPAHSVGESLLVKIDPEMGTLVGDPT